MNRVLAKLGLSVVLKMMLVDNLVHADLHPGNILVRELPNHLKPVWESFWCDMWQRVAGEEARVSPQLVLVDAGMTAIMDRAESTHLVKFFQVLVASHSNWHGGLEYDQKARGNLGHVCAADMFFWEKISQSVVVFGKLALGRTPLKRIIPRLYHDGCFATHETQFAGVAAAAFVFLLFEIPPKILPWKPQMC